MEVRNTNGLRITYREIVIGELIRRDGAICNICKQPLNNLNETETDHIVPLRLNGANDFTNLQLTHKSCHRKKDRDLIRLHHIKPNGTRRVMRSRQIPPWRLTAEKKIRKEIDQYVKEGKSIVFIAKTLKISRPTVYDFLARADLE